MPPNGKDPIEFYVNGMIYVYGIANSIGYRVQFCVKLKSLSFRVPSFAMDGDFDVLANYFLSAASKIWMLVGLEQK